MNDDLKEAHRQAISDRQKSYALSLSGETAKLLLDDLARFCRANKSTFHADPRIHAVLEGRREVWLRIRDHLDLTTEELIEKIEKGTP